MLLIKTRALKDTLKNKIKNLLNSPKSELQFLKNESLKIPEISYVFWALKKHVFIPSDSGLITTTHFARLDNQKF